MRDVVSILGTSGKLLELDQVGNRGNAHRCRGKSRGLRALPELFERDRMINEEIHGPQRIIAIEHGKHLHAPVPDPLASNLRIGEVHRIHRRPGLESQAYQRINGLSRRPGIQVDDQINVGGEPRVPMQNNRESTDHHVANTGSIQLVEERFEDGHPGIVRSIRCDLHRLSPPIG